jgi:basic amino acid/polyamine antiporter, APA family
VLGAAFLLHPEALSRNVHLGTSPSVRQLILAVAVAMLAYTGFEAIADLPDEARNPDRDLKRTVPALLGSVVAVNLALAVVAIMAMPVEQISGRPATQLGAGPSHGAAAYPLLGIVSRLPLHVLSTGLRYFTGLVIAAMLLGATQAGVRGVVKTLHSLARDSQLPARVVDVHPRYRTPYTAAGLAAVGAAALVLAQTAVAGGAGVLAGVYVYGALITLTAVQASILALRLRDPLRSRPFKVGGNIPLDTREIPVTAVVGAACTAVAWAAVVLWQRDSRYVGTAWMLLGLAGYAAYRRRRGLGLGEPARRDIAPRVGPGIEVEYRTMLIPINTEQTEIASEVVEVAARLAAERGASVLLLALTEIPLGEELDMELDDVDERVDLLASQARAIGDRYGIRVHTTHLRTRDPAESILREASRRGSDVILLGAGGLHRAGFRRLAHDQVVMRVAAEAGQRVMIIQPAAA